MSIRELEAQREQERSNAYNNQQQQQSGQLRSQDYATGTTHHHDGTGAAGARGGEGDGGATLDESGSESHFSIAADPSRDAATMKQS